jgi:threonine dehydratase
VVTYDRKTTSREELSASIASERRLTVIPPFNHPHVIAGQGTAAMELIEETIGYGGLDWLFVCCGGAGLLTGSALAARHLVPHCKVVGVEPQAGDDATRSFRTRTLQTVSHPDTIADGARTESLGSLTFPLMLALVDDMMTVDDTELVAAMRLLWERLKIVVEPTGALATAGVLKAAHPTRGTRVGVIVSGGNVDLASIGRLMTL